MSKQYLGRDFGAADGTDSDKIKPGMLNTLAEVGAFVLFVVAEARDTLRTRVVSFMQGLFLGPHETHRPTPLLLPLLPLYLCSLSYTAPAPPRLAPSPLTLALHPSFLQECELAPPALFCPTRRGRCLCA